METRVRRSMLFLNAQRASLMKDAFVYQPDCVIFDLEDAVSQNEKDSARVQLFYTLQEINYRGVERWVRINGLDTDLYKEDIRAAIAGGCEGIRMPMTESAEDIHLVEKLIAQAEEDFGREVGSTLIMAALESPKGVMNAYEIATSTPRMMGIALSAGDFRRTMHAKVTQHGMELLAARSQIVMAARAAGVMCFDTVYTDVDNREGFKADVQFIQELGFDGKSCITPQQVMDTHEVLAPSAKEIRHSQRIIDALKQNEEEGVGVLVVDGMMVDVAMIEGAQRTLDLAKVSGLIEEDKE